MSSTADVRGEGIQGNSRAGRDVTNKSNCVWGMPYISKVEEQLATRTVIQHKKEFVCCLEGHLEAHDVRMIDVAQYTALCLCVFHLQRKARDMEGRGREMR